MSEESRPKISPIDFFQRFCLSYSNILCLNVESQVSDLLCSYSFYVACALTCLNKDGVWMLMVEKYVMLLYLNTELVVRLLDQTYWLFVICAVQIVCQLIAQTWMLFESCCTWAWAASLSEELNSMFLSVGIPTSHITMKDDHWLKS